MEYKVGNRLEYLLIVIAILVVLFAVFNFRSWMIPNDIEKAPLPGKEDTKRIVTIYNNDKYKGVSVRKNMVKISESEEYKDIQFIFINILKEPAAASTLPYDPRDEYAVYFLDKNGDVIWYINKSYSNNMIHTAIDKYLLE